MSLYKNSIHKIDCEIFLVRPCPSSAFKDNQYSKVSI